MARAHRLTEFNEEIRRELPPVQQLLVRRHAGSGRKTLYLASHASHIIGRPVEEGRKLIEELVAFATQPQFSTALRRSTPKLGAIYATHRGRTRGRGAPNPSRSP